MNKGLEILLKRIGTHPEEFDRLFRHRRVDRNGNVEGWEDLVNIVMDKNKSNSFVTEEERSHFQDKILEVQGHLFSEAVMRKLFELTNDDSSDET